MQARFTGEVIAAKLYVCVDSQYCESEDLCDHLRSVVGLLKIASFSDVVIIQSRAAARILNLFKS